MYEFFTCNTQHKHTQYTPHTHHMHATHNIYNPLPLEIFGKDSRGLSKESVRVLDPLFVENSKRHPLRRIWGMRRA